jgi:four helix bundle protein
MGNFRTLRAWQLARRLTDISHEAIDKLPTDERFALAQQWRRATYSVALNLAEGAGRRTNRDFRRFVAAARGSLDEIEAILDIAEGFGYLPPEVIAELKQVRKQCAQLVTGLLHKLDAMVEK